MTTRATYDELSTPHDLYGDCRKIGARMRADRIARAPHVGTATRRALAPGALATPTRQPGLRVDASTARLAKALYDS